MGNSLMIIITVSRLVESEKCFQVNFHGLSAADLLIFYRMNSAGDMRTVTMLHYVSVLSEFLLVGNVFTVL